MNALNVRVHSRFQVTRLALCVILVAAAILGQPTPGFASGQTTHRDVVDRALDWLDSDHLKDLLTAYPDAVESGAVFPDWGYYAARMHGDVLWEKFSGEAEKEPFQNAFLNYMETHFTAPYDDYEKKTIAFWFGVISHGIADPLFHEGFLPAAIEGEASKPNHTTVETAVNSFSACRFNYFDYTDYFFPLDAIMAAYTEVYPTGLPVPLDAGTLGVELYGDLLHWIPYKWFVDFWQDTTRELCLFYAATYPWIYNNYLNYYPGGIGDQTLETRNEWYWRWYHLGPRTSVQVSPAEPDGENGWYTMPVGITLSTTGYTLGGAIATWYSLDNGPNQPYSEPFTISAEGEQELSAYSVNTSLGTTGNVEHRLVKIDGTPPVVSVSVDQARYTRDTPLVVHFDGYDPAPGSGMASLTAEFDSQPVSDGQTVDLLWLALGNHTLAARGEDYAGWVTEASQTIELVASLEGLQATVDRLCQEGYITDSDVCSGLSDKLDAALDARNRGNLNAAANALNAFQNAVEAQRDKAIADAAADLLLTDSDYVIHELSQ